MVSMGHQVCGALELWNYPVWIRNLVAQDVDGTDKPNHVDFAALERKAISEEEQVEKVLRVLPKSKWNVKMTAIREANKDLAGMTLDELVGNLRTYEMEIDGNKVLEAPEDTLALKASYSDEEIELDKEQVAFIAKNFSKFLKKKREHIVRNGQITI
ncbi:alpha-dioxygenase 2-like [Capsicum annuum]|uniref:alpha-dioxygenase 2-like n=1 Tax=Capsicum annuum TaxID=4072 RepID=UPI0007BFAA6B|nr:alpha-dioxygenase 2-like [Capsicum annuum]